MLKQSTLPNAICLKNACKFPELKSQTENGGAIYLNINNYFSSAAGDNIIKNCDFIKCLVSNKDSTGGAIYISANSPYSVFKIEYCNFDSNGAYTVNFHSNSIYFEASNGAIQYCIFTNQQSIVSSYGVAIAFVFSAAKTASSQVLSVDHNNFKQSG